MTTSAEEFESGLRLARFPDLWAGCRTWAGGLMQWHSRADPTAWSPAEIAPEEYVDWVSALIACALYTAAQRCGLDDADGSGLLDVPLAEAAADLRDAATAVHTIDSVPEPPTGLREPLASIPHWLDQGTTEQKQVMLFIIGLSRQVLAFHGEESTTVREWLPLLARATEQT